VLRPVFRDDGTPDLEATLAAIPALARVGVTMVEVLPLLFCRGPQDLDTFCKQLVAAGRQAG